MVVAGLTADYVVDREAGRGREVGLAEAKPRERGQGNLLLAEHFSRPSPAGWSFAPARPWSIQGGRLRAVLPDAKQEKAFAYFGSASWRDYSVDVDVHGIRGVDKGLAFRVQGERGLAVDLRGAGYDDVVLYRGDRKLAEAPVANRNGRWHHLRVEARGFRYKVYVNGRLKIDHEDRDRARPSGRLALAAYTGGTGECEVMYDNVVVRSLR